MVDLDYLPKLKGEKIDGVINCQIYLQSSSKEMADRGKKRER